jgi:hypothetical protein
MGRTSAKGQHGRYAKPLPTLETGQELENNNA